MGAFMCIANNNVPPAVSRRLLLTVIFTATYSVNMLVAEMYFEEVGDIMQFILLKYCVGTLHHLLSPLAVLVSYPEVMFSKCLAIVVFTIRYGAQRCGPTTEGGPVNSRPR